MKEILVRAWDKETQKMWTDVLHEMGEVDNYDDVLSMWSVGRMMETGDNSRFEFMQYVGRKDDEGTFVYDGDILLFEANRVSASHDSWCQMVGKNDKEVDAIGVVKWSEHSTQWVLDTKFAINEKHNKPIGNEKHPRQLLPPSNCGIKNYRSIKVIGNIYENPELLQG